MTSFSGYPHMESILDIARWAPSGDNSQPWRFEVIDSNHLCIHAQPNLENIYEYNNGQPTLISCGILIETIGIAASSVGRACEVESIEVVDDQDIAIKLSLFQSKKIVQSDLLPFVKSRSVDRGAYQATPPSLDVIKELEDIVGEQFDVTWYRSFSEKLSVTKLNCMSGDIRLRIPEAYNTHKNMFNYKDKFCEDRLPIRASGASLLTRIFMKWILAKWSRTNFVNRYLAGTIVPQIEFDLLPGLMCGAHFSLSFKEPMRCDVPEDVIKAGMSVQRFWLCLEKNGLVMQPSFSTLAYASYGSEAEDFTTHKACNKKGRKLHAKTQQVFRKDISQLYFLGRIGVSKKNVSKISRSVRKPLSDLMRYK